MGDSVPWDPSWFCSASSPRWEGGVGQGSFWVLTWPFLREGLHSQTQETLPPLTAQQHFANCCFLKGYLKNHLQVKQDSLQQDFQNGGMLTPFIS